MNPGVKAIAPARLHLGFLDLAGDLGRRYGSIGLAIDQPATVLRLEGAERFEASGAEAVRARTIVEQTAAALGVRRGYRVSVEEAIPAHAGLGSGTQLALAIAGALLAAEGRRLTVEDMTALTGRGARSAIGMAAYAGGGFIIDGGRGEADRPPPVLVRHDFPPAWRAILVLDRSEQGAHGDRESKAFAALPRFPPADAAHLSRLVLLRLLPGLVEADLGAFGSALTEIQEVLGRHFAAAQGGSPWTSPAVGRLVKKLACLGAEGIGQTSWGPTGFAFTDSETAARRLYHSLVEEATAGGLELRIVSGRNSGATIELH